MWVAHIDNQCVGYIHFLVQQQYKGYKAYAWCKPMSLPLLIEKGFKKGDNCVYVEKII